MGAESDQSSIAGYEALLMVSKAISSHRNLTDLFAAITTELRRVAQFDGIVIMQDGPGPREIRWHVSQFAGQSIAKMPESISDDDICRVVLQTQKPMVVQSVESEVHFPQSLSRLEQAGVQSFCMLPLTTARRRLGVLGLASKRIGAYLNTDLRFLSAVADQTALAIDATLHLDEIRAVQADLKGSRERLKLLLDINNSVISNLDLRQVFLSISSNLRSALRCDAVGLALPARGSLKLEGYVLDFPDGQNLFTERSPVPPFMQQVFDSGIPLRQASWEGDLADSRVRRAGIHVGCHVPVQNGSQTLGVLTLGRRDPVQFSDEDLNLLRDIGIQVALAIQNALAYEQIGELKEQLAREKVYLENEIRTELNFEEIIGRSEPIARVLKQVETVAPTDSTVVIYGETGTGKELLARAVHSLSSRSKKPFVKLNCAAIPAGLLESELFGHERGAFTGAVSQRIGRFELANEGTVFLDEIGELPLELQPKLLRVLQEGEFERLGSSHTTHTNARLIAATNRDLLAMVAEQKFRADLYYRLNVFPLHVPLLRERREDIPLLVRHFVQHHARRMSRRIETIPSETMKALTEYAWPGNIRELQNLIERAVILSPGPVLNVHPGDLRTQSASPEGTAGIQSMEESERKHILRALDAANWVLGGPKGAAALLGLKRTTLQGRMAKLGITRGRGQQ